MSSFLQLVTDRRSVRVYKSQNIKREDLELCVKAAQCAPSACNSQPWKFIIIDDARVKKTITGNIFSGVYKMNAFARGAGAFIAIVSEKTKPFAWLAKNIRNTDFKKIDIGIACDHLILQAQELGVGTCILGWFNERKLKKILFVPSSKKIELVVALGYPRQKQPIRTKEFKNKSETVSFNKY